VALSVADDPSLSCLPRGRASRLLRAAQAVHAIMAVVVELPAVEGGTVMIEFSEQEVDTIRDLIRDWGSDCPDTDYDKVRLLAERLGVWEPKKPPTPEQLEFLNKLAPAPIKELTQKAALAWLMARRPLLYALTGSKEAGAGEEFAAGKIGTQLRIRLPSDYQVAKEEVT
jgi:hypothetical protein